MFLMSSFHWSLQGSLVSIGQHFITTRVVHLPKRTETSLITESDQSGPNHRIYLWTKNFQFMIFTIANDHFIVWPSSVILTFNLPDWTNVSNEQLCQIILKSMHKCRSYGPDKLNFDHYIIWPSNVTLTFNLPEQMFLMNNCVKLFWNSCLNVEVTAQTSSSYDHFIIWSSGVTWPSTYLIRSFIWTTMPNYFKIHAYMY